MSSVASSAVSSGSTASQRQPDRPPTGARDAVARPLTAAAGGGGGGGARGGGGGAVADHDEAMTPATKKATPARVPSLEAPPPGVPDLLGRRVIAGHLDDLPALSSRIVRIFLSSTFTGQSARHDGLCKDVCMTCCTYWNGLLALSICTKGVENERRYLLVISITLMPKNAILKQTTLSSLQITKYLRFARI